MSMEEDKSAEKLDEQHEEEEGEEDGQEEASEEGEEQIAEGEGGAEEEEEEAGAGGLYNADEVNDQIFEELRLSEEICNEVRNSWGALMKAAESREAAGEAIYAALFDAAPSLQSLFKTPRAVMAMRFMNGLNQIIYSMHEPKNMKVIVETYGFMHLDLEVTPPRTVIFRDAIVDLLQVELGSRFSKKAREGWRTMLNYVGGSYIYVRAKFSVRLKILLSSWATANNKAEQIGDEAEAVEGKEEEEEKQASGEEGSKEAAKDKEDKKNKEGKKDNSKEAAKDKEDQKNKEGKKDKDKKDAKQAGSGEASGEARGMSNAAVPTSYSDMFMFNAAVMGYKGSIWMAEVLASFDTIVMNVANSYRLQEECDVLSLKIAKYKGQIKLPEYKAVMLASLRSLVPKDWNSDHEAAWSWLWDNVERMLKNLMGKPAAQEKALENLIASFDEETQSYVRREVYVSFFAIAPAGQDYFKQSTTRLHFIADKVVEMTMDIYKDPKRMVEDISALGLRHVGYGIPTDLFGAFVTGCVDVIRKLTKDDLAVDAFRWSLSLVSRMLTRVINEGSTIVMKAINGNSAVMLRKAVGCAPRGKRALWMLNIQVGTKSISPLLWAIETGGLDAASAIITDLLVIRADRERYYYGMDTMFERHPDIIKIMCADARSLLPTLLDGLIWRSRVTENGMRRVNYYIKHFLVDEEGEFSKAIEWITETRDPKIVCHPVLELAMDTVWNKVALRSFVSSKCFFIFTLVVFVCSQSILNHINSYAEEATGSGSSSGSASGSSPGHRLLAATGEVAAFEFRLSIFICRCFIYLCSMGQLIYTHGAHVVKDVKAGDFVIIGCFKLPAYLTNWQDAVGISLMFFLITMLSLEPILHCLGQDGPLFNEHCEKGEELIFPYSVLSAISLFCYYLLLIDLAVFSTRISAFVLVCSRLLSEVALFLFGLAFIALAFASAVSALEQNDVDFAGIPTSALSFLKITFAMFAGDRYDALHEHPALLIAVLFYIVATVVFLLNLLIAQLNCAYQSTYQDMLGYARLNRGKIVTETMATINRKRWQQFLDGLKLDERVEFGEGDLGLAGGVQVFEPASANITTVDMIKRFGGSTSQAAQWPEETGANADEDRLDRMEKQIEKTIKIIQTRAQGGKKGGSAGAGSSLNHSDTDQEATGDGSGVEHESASE